jgi:hypothetical protein
MPDLDAWKPTGTRVGGEDDRPVAADVLEAQLGTLVE